MSLFAVDSFHLEDFANDSRNVLMSGIDSSANEAESRRLRGAVNSTKRVRKIAVSPPAVIPLFNSPPASSAACSGKIKLF